MLNDEDLSKLRTYLLSLMPTCEMVDGYVTANAEGETSSIPELGWVPKGERWSSDGVGGTSCHYSYQADRGRTAVNYEGQPSRVHTYGNSFTHCDQVSNGETWQEYLAAHIQEPVRNFGVGGWSVYQAYRRMCVIEMDDPAEHLILNAWSDDHFRNLDAWRSVRMNRIPRWTLPHLRVKVGEGTFEEMPNPCPTLEDHYKLCDPDWVWDRFADDPTVRAAGTERAGIEPNEALCAWVADGFGFAESAFDDLEPSGRLWILHLEAALFATRCVIEMAESFASLQERKLMVLLSFGKWHVEEALKEESLYDQTLLDWLADRDTLVVDLRDGFRADYAISTLPTSDYLEPFYNGHHTPRGNFLFAWVIKDAVVEWLDPKPVPYR
ncbi:MAG TPA: hypothetical protein DHW45_19085 [Candidatus Latescibacteria bacterium]|nr:hypothetical protein [Candidatus Latescibacterota bacterium]